MTGRGGSGVQRVLLRMLPWWAPAMEAESRAWTSTCACGRSFSVWDAGGIRFKAKGNPTTTLRCPACGTTAARPLSRR